MLCRRLLQAPLVNRPFPGLGLRRAAASVPDAGAGGQDPSTPGRSSAPAEVRTGGGRKFGNGVGRGTSRPTADAEPQSGTKPTEPPDPQTQVKEELDTHIKNLQARAATGKGMPGEFKTTWRNEPGHQVAYRFRIQTPPERQPKQQRDQAKLDQAKLQKTEPPYSDFVGLRFPTLETAENFDYHKDRGLDRVVERAYPIKVPGYRRLDPYLREYIHFLHDLDPSRFTVSRIAQRYRLREKTVAKVVQEWGVSRYLTRSGLTRLREKQVTREEETLKKKEQQYAKWVGYDQLGDEDDPESDDEALGEFKGWRSTNDWIRRQNVEVEMMSAFPLMEKRDPMPKRVDIDLMVDSRQHHKVINWIDPTDKVVF